MTSGSAPEKSSRLLEVKNLSVEYRSRRGGVVAVDEVSLALRPGQRLGVVGESGSGKSTLGLAIAGLLPPSASVSGSVRYLDKELVGSSRKTLRRIHGREIGVVFQDAKAALNPVRTVGAQVSEAVFARGDISRSAARAKALHLLEEVKIPEAPRRLRQYPHELSGGMRQRVTVAIALAQEPRLLIADEPTSALDVTSQAALIRLIKELGDQRDMATILITHDLGVVATFADDVFVLYAGRAMETASTVPLFTAGRHPYTRALVSAVPRLEQSRMERLPFIDGSLPHNDGSFAGCVFEQRCVIGVGQRECLDSRPAFTIEGDGSAVACHFPDQHAPPRAEPGEENGSGRQRHLLHVEPTNPLPVSSPADVRHAPTSLGCVGRNTSPVLDVHEVGKNFRLSGGGADRAILRALERVSFSVRSGEAFGVVGESGSGKTTIARIIVGLLEPSAGSVTVASRPGDDQVDPRGDAALTSRWRAGEVQMVFQDPTDSLNPYMTIEEIVREPLEITSKSKRRDFGKIVAGALSDVGLPERFLQRRPGELSVGQRQRVAIARSLTTDPVLIVADEPVSALDVSARGQVLNLLADIQRDRHLACINISHDLSIIKHTCDRVAVLHAGRLVELAPTEDLFAYPRHPYTQALLDAVPVIDPAARRPEQSDGLRGEVPDLTQEDSGCRFRTRCPFARELCEQQDPALEGNERGHTWACHFPLQRGTANDAPPATITGQPRAHEPA